MAVETAKGGSAEPDKALTGGAIKAEECRSTSKECGAPCGNARNACPTVPEGAGGAPWWAQPGTDLF